LLRYVFCIDESHLLTRVSPDRSDLSEPVITTLVREARKFDFGCILVDQVVSSIPVEIPSTCNTLMAFRLNSGSEVRNIGDNLALSYEERDFLTQIPQQMCIVRTSRHPKAFVVRIPDVEQEDIAEEEIRQATERALAELSWKPRCQPEVKKREPEPREDVVAQDEQNYLKFCAEHPGLMITETYRLFGVKAWKGNALKKSLEQRGFINAFTYSTGKKGGVITLVEVTVAGYEYLRKRKMGVTPPRGRGGGMHVAGQTWIRWWYEARYPGCEVKIEEEVENSQRVDVGVRIGERRVAVELLVEGFEKERFNIEKVLNSGRYQELVLVAAKQRDLGKLQKMAKEVCNEVDKGETEITVKLLNEFVPERWS